MSSVSKTKPRRVCGAASSFVSLPVPDLGVPRDSQAFVQIVHALAERIRGGASVAVHCRQSVGRSGTLAVFIVVALGVSLESSIECVSRARGAPVPETQVQLEWLRRNLPSLFNRRPRRPFTAPPVA